MWMSESSAIADVQAFAWLASTFGMVWISTATPWWRATSGSSYSSRANT
jgi:hypothetical protein